MGILRQAENTSPLLVARPAAIKAGGSPPKIIEEYFGHVRTGTAEVSIARMKSPPGWSEPGQTPVFNEYSLVLKGALLVKTRRGTLVVKAGQAVLARAGEWVQYSTPGKRGAEYVAICVPAFSQRGARRDRRPPRGKR